MVPDANCARSICGAQWDQDPDAQALCHAFRLQIRLGFTDAFPSASGVVLVLWVPLTEFRLSGFAVVGAVLLGVDCSAAERAHCGLGVAFIEYVPAIQQSLRSPHCPTGVGFEEAGRWT